MAQTALRLYLRRAYSLSTAAAAANSHTPLRSSAVPHRGFHSSLSLALAAAPAWPSFYDMDKTDPDVVLFEGCDYNHWLIVMDFGKDPTQRPPPHQMVETYVQTAAQVLGSVEEAKRKIYACSTTVYPGFQVEVDEETSKKFEGLPGVMMVLPDSYLDPVNKEYGGDKYINGEIIPRPPPPEYVRRNSFYKSSDQRPSAPNQSEPMPQPPNFSPQQNHSRGTQTRFNQADKNHVNIAAELAASNINLDDIGPTDGDMMDVANDPNVCDAVSSLLGEPEPELTVEEEIRRTERSAVMTLVFKMREKLLSSSTNFPKHAKNFEEALKYAESRGFDVSELKTCLGKYVSCTSRLQSFENERQNRPSTFEVEEKLKAISVKKWRLNEELAKLSEEERSFEALLANDKESAERLRAANKACIDAKMMLKISRFP